jgi:cell division protease FtsH
VAEELIFGAENITTGAADDIRQATALARRMVTEWGMSEKLGPLRFSDNEEEVFLGHSVTQRKNVSDATAKLIDEEIHTIISAAEARARAILTEHLDDMHRVAKALLEFETLSGDEIKALIRGETIVRPEETKAPPSSGARSSVPPTRGKKAPPAGLAPEPQPGS